MELKDLIVFVEADDQSVSSEKMVKLLDKIEQNTRPSDVGGENNVMIPLEVDLNQTYDDYLVWEDDPSLGVDANSLTINAVDIDYYYAIERGKWVLVDTGMIMEVSGHKFTELRIRTTETLNDRMRIVVSGRKRY